MRLAQGADALAVRRVPTRRMFGGNLVAALARDGARAARGRSDDAWVSVTSVPRSPTRAGRGGGRSRAGDGEDPGAGRARRRDAGKETRNAKTRARSTKERRD